MRNTSVVIRILLLFLALITFSISDGQAPAFQWKKIYGSIFAEQALTIRQTTDGGYIAAGFASANAGDVTGNQGLADFWVVKLTATGAIQWQQCYGGSGVDKAYAIEQTTDGGYIVAGSTTSSDGQVTGFHQNLQNALWSDYWVIKIDGSGVLQWQKTLGGTGIDVAYSIKQTTDEGYIVCGWSTSGDGDFINGGSLVKLTAAGTIQWQSYQYGNYFNSIQQTTDKGYILAGISQDDFAVKKIDSLGTVLWFKNYGGTGIDCANGIIQTADGGYLVAGYTQSHDGDVTGFHTNPLPHPNGWEYMDGWLIKIDTLGNLQWQKTLGGMYDEQLNSINPTADGGYILAALTNSNDGDVTGLHGVTGTYSVDHSISDYWTIKINNTGNIQWQKTMGGTYIEEANFCQQTTDGGYIVAGSTVNHVVNSGDITGFNLNVSNPNASQYDFWIVKLAPDVVVPVILSGFSAALTDNNNALLKWQTQTEWNNRCFDVQRSTDGVNFISIGTVKGYGTTSLPHNYVFTDINFGKINSAYYRLKLIDFDGKFTYSSITYLRSAVNVLNADITPNPSIGSFNLFIPFREACVQALVYDSKGALIKKKLCCSRNTIFNTSGWKAGEYLIKLIDTRGVTTTKRIIVGK